MPNELNANADLRAAITAMGASAREAGRELARSSTGQRNRALEAAAKELVDREKGRPIKKLEMHAEDGRLLAPGDTALKPRRSSKVAGRSRPG